MTVWKEGTEVTFTAKGKVNSLGHVEIGCQEFTQSDIQNHTTVNEVVEPKAKYQAGDVYGKPGQPARVRDADGIWKDPKGASRARSDATAERAVANHGFRFLVVGGVVVNG
jgi:hypothetical protein